MTTIWIFGFYVFSFLSFLGGLLMRFFNKLFEDSISALLRDLFFIGCGLLFLVATAGLFGKTIVV